MLVLVLSDLKEQVLVLVLSEPNRSLVLSLRRSQSENVSKDRFFLPFLNLRH